MKESFCNVCIMVNSTRRHPASNNALVRWNLNNMIMLYVNMKWQYNLTVSLCYGYITALEFTKPFQRYILKQHWICAHQQSVQTCTFVIFLCISPFYASRWTLRTNGHTMLLWRRLISMWTLVLWTWALSVTRPLSWWACRTQMSHPSFTQPMALSWKSRRTPK